MASLLELSNAARKVSVEGKDIEVFGISVDGLVDLMIRFPEIGRMFSGQNINSEALMKIAPDAVAAFIAAGCGQAKSTEAENIARKLSVAYQLDFIDEILRLTFPRGVGPFVEKLQGLGLLVRVEEVHLQSLQEQSKNSSATGTNGPQGTPPDKSSSTSS